MEFPLSTHSYPMRQFHFSKGQPPWKLFYQDIVSVNGDVRGSVEM